MSPFPYPHIFIHLLTFYRRDDWAKFTNYRWFPFSDKVIEWFWTCVRSWPPAQRSRLLWFATGTTRVPINGFEDLQGPHGRLHFTIEWARGVNGLPTRHPSFNRIGLPSYTDYTSLERNLTSAVDAAHVSRRGIPIVD